MTPDELNEIRKRSNAVYLGAGLRDPLFEAVTDVRGLLDYIDLLHEDLRITRQERDHAKHQALEHRKARAQAEKDTK